MPYIPPHLRPGYVPTETKPVDLSGKVHWPTDVNSFRSDNIIESKKTHSPHKFGIVSKKILKLTNPIVMNTKPIVVPGSRVAKFHNAVTRHIKLTEKKSKTKKIRSMRHKPSKKTRRH